MQEESNFTAFINIFNQISKANKNIIGEFSKLFENFSDFLKKAEKINSEKLKKIKELIMLNNIIGKFIKPNDNLEVMERKNNQITSEQNKKNAEILKLNENLVEIIFNAERIIQEILKQNEKKQYLDYHEKKKILIISKELKEIEIKFLEEKILLNKIQFNLLGY